MSEFGQQVKEWQLFYATIAGSSATLVGLLFVALSVRPEAWNRAKHSGITSLARQTFTTFLYIIGIALTFLIPGQEPLTIGLPLVLISLLGLRITVSELRTARGEPTQGMGARDVLRRAVLKIAGFGMLIAISAALMLQGDARILGWMVAPMMVMLLSATLNSWVLLIAVQESSQKD